MKRKTGPSQPHPQAAAGQRALLPGLQAGTGLPLGLPEGEPGAQVSLPASQLRSEECELHEQITSE